MKIVETKLTYTNWFLPDRNEKKPKAERGIVERIKKFSHITKFAQNDAPLVAQPIVMRCEKGYFPELPEDKSVIDEDKYPRYGFEEVFLHVYGQFRTFHLKFQKERLLDNDLLLMMRDPEDCSRIVREDFCLGSETLKQCLIGAKLVFKKPPTKTVLGEVPMVKVYFGGDVSSFMVKNEVKTNSTIFRADVFDAVISPFTRWMISQKVSSIGQLILRTEGEPHVQTFFTSGYSYKYIDVHYKDIVFDNDGKFDLSEHNFKPLYTKLRENVLGSSKNYVTQQYVQKQTDDLEKIKFGDSETLQTCKGKMMKHLLRCVESGQGNALKNGAGRSTLYNYAYTRCQRGQELGELSSDLEYDELVSQQYNPFLVESVRFQYECTAIIKNYWKDVIQKKYYTAEKRSRQDALVQKIGQRLRVAALDIETYYKPHAKDNNKFMISAHATLYNECAHDIPMENVHFMYICKTRDEADIDVDIEKLAKEIDEGLGGGGNLIPGENFEIMYSHSQKELLTHLFEKIRSWKVNIITHYNGDSFDLSYIQMQLEQEGLYGCKPYFHKDANTPGIKIKRKTYTGLSFSDRPDNASISYKKEGKVAESKLRSMGVKNFVTKESEEMYKNEHELPTGNTRGEDEQEEFFFDKENNFELDERIQEMAAATLADNQAKGNKDVYNHMINAWEINSLCMKNTGSRDVMKTIPNEPFYLDPNNPFDKKLDSVAYGFLKLRKIHCEDVEYSNLAKTWESGSLYNLILYCAIDTLLVFKLDRLFKNGVKDIARARRAFKPMRELYGNKTQECTLSMMYSYMWYNGAVSHDPNVFKNEIEFWEPNFEYDPENHFWRLGCKAGRTITGCEGVYNDYGTMLSDFASQYSTIMDGRNICTTTMVARKDLKPEWVEGVHYIRVRVPNSRPETYHACAEGSEKCNFGQVDKDLTKSKSQRIAEYCAKCKWKHRYVPCSKDVFFVTEQVMAGTAKVLSRDLREERSMYKKLKAKCEDGDPLKEVYDIAQLDAKLAGNSIYGVMLRINSEVGGSITEFGRTDNESATLLLYDVSGPASMCDTDSTSSINRYWSLKPCRVPDHRVKNEIIEKMYELEPYRKEFEKGPYHNPEIDRSNDMDDTQGPLNRLCKILFPERWAEGDYPTIRELFTKIFKFYQDVMDELNDGEVPAWPKPSSLEIEKFMIGLNFPKKKMYTARMVEPGSFHMTTIIRGLACKKSDKSRLKILTQLGMMQMISEGDYKGAAEFAMVIYSTAMVYLRSKLIAESRIADMVSDIDLELELIQAPGFVDHLSRDLDAEELSTLQNISEAARNRIKDFDNKNGEEMLIKKYAAGLESFFLETDCQSKEKVNNIRNPVTVADKKEDVNRKRKGLSHEQSSSYASVYRGSSVQVGSHVISSINTLLVKPVKDEYEEEILKFHERQSRGLTEKKYQTEQKRKEATRARHEEEEKAFCPLKITDMPEHLKPHKDYCSEVSMRDRLRLLGVKYLVEDTEKAIEKEKKSKFMENELIVNLPPLFADKQRLERALDIFKKFKSDYKFFAHLLPLFWYDDNYCLTKIPELDQWYELPSSQSCVSFWPLYTTMGMKRRYILIKGGEKCQIKMTDVLEDGFKQYTADRMYFYEADNIKIQDGVNYYLDMHNDYALQTQSTPLLAVSSDGKLKYLVNRGSYCGNSKNRFAFRVDASDLLEMTRRIKHTATFEPVPGTKTVLINGEIELEVMEFIRDDDRKVGVWPFGEIPEPIEINMRDLRVDYLDNDFAHTENFNTSVTDFIFNDSLQRLEVINAVSPQVYTFRYISEDNPYVEPKKVNINDFFTAVEAPPKPVKVMTQKKPVVKKVRATVSKKPVKLKRPAQNTLMDKFLVKKSKLMDSSDDEDMDFDF